MKQFLISLDEVERVKRMNRIESTVDLANRTGLSRSTWGRAIKSRKPQPDVLNALAALGARPSHVLVEDSQQQAVA